MTNAARQYRIEYLDYDTGFLRTDVAPLIIDHATSAFYEVSDPQLTFRYTAISEAEVVARFGDRHDGYNVYQVFEADNRHRERVRISLVGAAAAAAAAGVKQRKSNLGRIMTGKEARQILGLSSTKK